MNSRIEKQRCAAVDDLLETYADGDLGAAAAARVERHLDGCSACSEQLARVREINATLAALPLLDAPEVLTESVAGMAADAGPVNRPFRVRIRILAELCLGRPRQALVEFALVAMIVAGFISQPWTWWEHPEFSPAEVAGAAIEIRASLGFVGRTLVDLSFEVENEYIPEFVIEPLQRPLKVLAANAGNGEETP